MRPATVIVPSSPLKNDSISPFLGDSPDGDLNMSLRRSVPNSPLVKTA